MWKSFIFFSNICILVIAEGKGKREMMKGVWTDKVG